jgi:hypothetical protein
VMDSCCPGQNPMDESYGSDVAGVFPGRRIVLGLGVLLEG